MLKHRTHNKIFNIKCACSTGITALQFYSISLTCNHINSQWCKKKKKLKYLSEMKYKSDNRLWFLRYHVEANQ